MPNELCGWAHSDYQGVLCDLPFGHDDHHGAPAPKGHPAQKTPDKRIRWSDLAEERVKREVAANGG